MPNLKQLEKTLTKVKKYSNLSEDNMNSATDTIGFSNLEEAYTNLYEGYNTIKDAMIQTRNDRDWANHYRKQAKNANVDSKAYAESGRLSNGQNIKGAKDFKIDADKYASSSKNFMNNSKNSSIQSCKKRNKSENSQHIANINKLNSDMDKQLAKYNRIKTELIRQKSDLYTNAIKDQVNLHKNTMEDYGTNVIANPSHALNLSFDDAVLQQIMTNTNEQISNIDKQYTDIETEENNYKSFINSHIWGYILVQSVPRLRSNSLRYIFHCRCLFGLGSLCSNSFIMPFIYSLYDTFTESGYPNELVSNISTADPDKRSAPAEVNTLASIPVTLRA